MDLPLENKISTIEESKVIASDFSKILHDNDIVVLNGNLGSGKTTLIKFICSNYGIHNVNSPSFSIVNEYLGERKIYHFDFYRIKNIGELYDIGFEDYINDEEAIIFIEWGSLMQEIIPTNHYEIELKLSTDKKRQIKIFKKN